jgi:heme/copper-type cytochrome/quinol oxidase subunit 2
VRRIVLLGIAAALVVVAGVAGALLVPAPGLPRERHIKLTARQYAFDPPIVEVNRGDTVRLRITSKDVIHGFFLEAYDINASIIPDSPYLELTHPSRPGEPPKKVEEIVFVADKPGSFHFRCSHTCGSMHPFMQGKLIVAPNRMLGAGIGCAVGLVLGAAFVAIGRDSRAR